MVALLGFAALAIDVGLMYAEKAQLQNGADAEALSIAQACAEEPGDEMCSETSPLAKTLADENANDGLTNIEDVALDKDAGTVTVITGAEESGGDENSVSLYFADALCIVSSDPACDFSSTEVGAKASAQWGTPVEGPVPFPITFSACEIEDGNALQLIQYYKKSSDAPSCLGGPPGGFGHLDSVADDECEAYVNVAETSGGGDPGNDGPGECTDLLDSWKESIIAGNPPIGLFPIHDSVTGSGNTAVYSLTGFAAFEIYGWKFKQGGSGQFEFQSDYGGFSCDKDCIGLIGKFVEHVELDDVYASGPAEDFGTDVVRLTLGDE